MKTAHSIGSGHALFILPGDRFINATKPLEASANSSTVKEVKNVRR